MNDPYNTAVGISRQIKESEKLQYSVQMIKENHSVVMNESK